MMTPEQVIRDILKKHALEETVRRKIDADDEVRDVVDTQGSQLDSALNQ